MFRRRKISLLSFAVIAAAITGVLSSARAADVRIKDLVTIEGRRTNQLVGIGLVTGLQGTGGSNPETRRFAVNFLERFGLPADPLLRAQLQTATAIKTVNLSVVTVTAELPAFASPGEKTDVVVSAFDNATSLQGGTLLFTPLLGADDEVYATATGPISIGGFSAGGQAANVQKNHPTTGRIVGGATIEKQVSCPIGKDGCIRLLLRQPDFVTAKRISAAVNHFLPQSAQLIDAAIVRVRIPDHHRDHPADFIADLEVLKVQPDSRAKVIINERTGTVIVGEHVRLSKVSITHGNLAIVTAETPEVSQPAPFSEGQTTVVPRTRVDVVEEKRAMTVIGENATVADLAQALNLLGVTPRDLSAIFQQLKESGSLHAELELK